MGMRSWNFFRAGGVDQVQLTKGADLASLAELDQKLWVALSCPVKGLEFDERTLKLIDSDGDGRVRAPELIQAGKWAASLLSDVEQLAKGASSLPLAAIQSTTEEGRIVGETARALLKALGKGDAQAISVEDMTTSVAAFDKEHENGDGIVPASAVHDVDLKKIVEDVVSVTPAPKKDRSGDVGLDAPSIDAFFESAKAYLAWSDLGQVGDVRFLGDKSNAAFAALDAVAAKIDDFFARTHVAAFDPRALKALNRDEAGYIALTEKTLAKNASELVEYPLATIAADAPLPLRTGLNPAWRDQMAAFVDAVVTPLLGAKDTLTSADWALIGTKTAAHRAWHASKAGAVVEKLGVERLRALAASDAKEKLHALVAADNAATPRAVAIEKVERLVHLNRDLMKLANNYVAFRDFYARKTPATFQCGTLYLDQRACELCIPVVDAARHATMAPLSRAYLIYCDLKNAKGETRTIVAAMTDGDVDNIMVGRNGIFYDRQGKDWDATVTKIVDNPISIRQAFWSPYKKFLRLIEEQLNKRASTAEAEANAKMTASAAAVETASSGDVTPEVKPPKKIDIGIVAALGVAVGGITAALGMVLESFFGLGLWMPLGVVGLMLLISGPSMAIAWLKLRQRNIGPILDANGWAVNALAHINVPFGRSLTQVATLPPGSTRDLVDPFAEKKKPWALYITGFMFALLVIAWFMGFTDDYLPKSARSTTVLGDAAPASVREKIQKKHQAEDDDEK
jgi:hypothetical protein